MSRCLFCNEPATHLCDAVIAMVEDGWHKPDKGPPYRVTTMEAMLSVSYTCDAPICGKHGRMVGHVCGKDHDTFDHCIGCVEAGREGRHGLMTPAQIEVTRRQWHDAYRRGRIHSIKDTP